MFVLFGARQVHCDSPITYLQLVTVTYILTSSVLNNQSSIAFRGTVAGNKFLDYEGGVGSSLNWFSNALLTLVIYNTNKVSAAIKRFN